MDSVASQHAAARFQASETWLGAMDAAAAAALIAAVADLALIVDDTGVIRDISVGTDEAPAPGVESWVDKPWTETVTPESVPKVHDILSAAAGGAPPRWRQVNHPLGQGTDLAVRYTALALPQAGRVLAIGRDLRAISALQQRLVAAQQSMERDYSRLRHAETRYRLLFQLTGEPVLIVDATSQRITDANPAAGRLAGEAIHKRGGAAIGDCFDREGAIAVQTLLATVRSSGRADDIEIRLSGGRPVRVSASMFRQDGTAHFLLRLVPADTAAQPPPVAEAGGRSRLAEVVAGLPDGFVVTGADRRILTVNGAFLDLSQLATEEQARGELIDRWLGRTSVDVSILVSNLRDHGSVRLFPTAIRGDLGSIEEVEVSAVFVPEGNRACFGFSIRPLGYQRRPGRASRDLPRSAEQLTDLIGRVPLKDLVRETTDMIERLCIEAALDLTGDNRASAAEMLGLSRQSLYVKLRRYGLGDLGADGDAG